MNVNNVFRGSRLPVLLAAAVFAFASVAAPGGVHAGTGKAAGSSEAAAGKRPDGGSGHGTSAIKKQAVGPPADPENFGQS